MLPLNGLRVIDCTDGRGAGVGRFLADLGADVVLVEPPGGLTARRSFPRHNGHSLGFCAHATNKRSVVLDLTQTAERDRFHTLLAAADIWVDGSDPGALDGLGLAPHAVRSRHPQLIVLSITEFGQWGPYRDRAATSWTHLALAPVLCRSGLPGYPPLMPPDAMVDGVVSAQAAWVALLAYWHRLHTGVGDHLDVSLLEALAQGLDPAAGSIGTAAAAQGGAGPGRGRSSTQVYPVFSCRDGHVRIVVLAPRQWHALFQWLGEPQQFANGKFEQIFERLKSAPTLYPLIADLFANQSMFELVREGQRRGVPIAPVLTPAQTLETDHFKQRQTFAEVDVGGSRGQLPSGYVLVDGQRAGIRAPVPAAGEHQHDVAWGPRPNAEEPDSTGAASTHTASPGGPLAGLRVLDLGVIVVGAEAGRLFADQGADVIKVENRRYPDGARASGMSSHFASGQRNKRSVGIDLRMAEGVEVFERLVAVSDLMLSNFKPGTLESLGLGYDRLSTINPGIVLVTSSAMGEWGPWRDWMGYGPLVRCVSGLTHLWQDPAAQGFGDTSTIYPDHVVGRIVDSAALAALIARRTTGRGCHIESSQAEAIVTALAPVFLRESLQPGSAMPRTQGEADVPWGVYPCAGDDEWCVVTVRNDDDWLRLVRALDHPPWASAAELQHRAGRVAARVSIDEGLSSWTRRQSPREVSEHLQAAGIPVAAMQRSADLVTDPHLTARKFFRRFRQPGIQEEVITENGPCVAETLPEPEIRPAPFAGEHTRAVCREVLEMTEAEIDALLARGALEQYEPSEA